MRTILRYVGALATALLCVAVVGACGGDDESVQSLPAADDGGGDDSGGARAANRGSGEDNGDGGTANRGGGDNGGSGAPGIPAGGSSAGARGAPINIPALTLLSGLTVDEVKEHMENKIRAECGGDLCIVVETEVQGDGVTNCEYRGDPPENTTVERGSTLVITAVCESGSETEAETGGGSETEAETGGSETETETDSGAETETEGTT